jgi:predicted dehydrogenase
MTTTNTRNIKPLGVAVVGCGNIASFYCSTMPRHPILQLKGVMDLNDKRSGAYANYYGVRKYDTLREVLEDPDIELVVNVTNPRSHYEISKASLEGGKHVYSEKPLAMTVQEARELVSLAESQSLHIASAPSRILAETAQAMWRAIREGQIGKVRAIYAEMDGGLVSRLPYNEWHNELGMHWPYWDEFEVGCTIEHAGYPVSWLTAFFGPVQSVTAFAACQIPELKEHAGLRTLPADLTVACLKFRSGPVARLTTSWIAPDDHSIRIFGDTGILSTSDVWTPRCPVYITRPRTFRLGPKSIVRPWRTRYKLPRPPRQIGSDFSWNPDRLSPRALARRIHARFLHLRKRVDFCLGPAELASAVREERQIRLSPEYCLHNTEIVLAIHNSNVDGTTQNIQSTFRPMEPMSWN